MGLEEVKCSVVGQANVLCILSHHKEWADAVYVLFTKNKPLKNENCKILNAHAYSG